MWFAFLLLLAILLRYIDFLLKRDALERERLALKQKCPVCGRTAKEHKKQNKKK